MNAVLGDLPTWNLADLYSSPTGPDLLADLKRADAEAEAFATDYEGKIAGLDGKALGAAIAQFEAMSDRMGRIGSYASLYYAQDMADPERGRFSQNVSEKLTDIGSKLVFFRLEINKLEDADLAAKLKEPALAKYGPWLRDLRAFRPHQLSDELEKALHEKYVVGRAAWSRLFDETIARLRYPFRNEVLSEPQILDKLSNKDADGAQGRGQIVRQGAGRQHRGLLAGHQHAGQGQGDRGPLAQVSAAAIVDEPAERRRGRGGRRARLVGEGSLSAARAPLLQAQGQVVRRRHDAVLGPQRAAARARRPHHPVARGREDRARCLRRLLAGAGVGRQEVLRHRLDRRAGAAGQVAGRLRPSDRAVGASRICC